MSTYWSQAREKLVNKTSTVCPLVEFKPSKPSFLLTSPPSHLHSYHFSHLCHHWPKYIQYPLPFPFIAFTPTDIYAHVNSIKAGNFSVLFMPTPGP